MTSGIIPEPDEQLITGLVWDNLAFMVARSSKSRPQEMDDLELLEVFKRLARVAWTDGYSRGMDSDLGI